MKQINKCPICRSNSTTLFLTRTQVPVHQNLVFQDIEAARRIARGDLELVVCHDCGFIHNQSFDPAKLSYGDRYDNTQTCSPSFKAYVEEIIHHLVYEKNVQDCCIVEIGCGKGEFLKNLAREGRGNIGYGFDPSYVGPEVTLEGRLKFEKRYYSPDCSYIPADVAVCRHVIEHVHDPIGMLKTVRQTLINSAHARVFFETPCVEWILRNQVIWDFFYEHCSFFSKTSLITAFELTGFEVQEVKEVFNGQYLWLEAIISAGDVAVTHYAGNIPRLASTYAKIERDILANWSNRITQLRTKGKVGIWGAGAKGVTFANLIDPRSELLDCVVDINPNKQGKYIAGSGHAIVDYQEAAERGIRSLILMNPNYHEENAALLHKAGLHVDLIE